VGNVTESDVRLAQNSNSIVYGFNVETTPVAKRLAEGGGVEIKNYKVIYELVTDIKNKLIDMMEPEVVRNDFGKMKVLAIFKNGKKDMIVGGKVIAGHIMKGSQIEVFRAENSIGKGDLANLQQNKIDVDEVSEGRECGVTFNGETKIKEGDILVSYKEEVKKKTL
jgi:translation initiation factor IF-2